MTTLGQSTHPIRRAAPGFRLPLGGLIAGLIAGLLLGPGAAAQGQGIEPALGDDTPAEHSWIVPALEIVGFDLLLNRYNRRYSGSSDYDVDMASVRSNLRRAWVVDNDPFKINQFAHPYQGSLYHGAGRSAGLGYWQSAALTFAGSAWWEITGERTTPARNDQIASGIAGSLFGEPLFRMAHLVLQGGGMPDAWRSWGAAAVSPALGLNRLAYGSRFDAAFADHDPALYSRLRIGASHATRHEFNSPVRFRKDTAQLDYALDYGLPGRDGYLYRRPFDLFAVQALLSSANGVENLSSRGLLVGRDYAWGANWRGVWGLFGSYDYLAPQIFHVSTTSLALGSTAQWWLGNAVALQGTLTAGLGYAAASDTRGVTTDDREYHYGTAPRLALALRMIVDKRASLDLAAQRISLGRINHTGQGQDDISRVDASLTWRVSGRHALGLNYVWSHRSANYVTLAESRQTLAQVGLYYTLLGHDGFGAVEWRPGMMN
jgi:hypothetical protein